MTPEEAARLIEGFLAGNCSSIEWCDFAETRQEDPKVESCSQRCDKLGPMINRPGEMDGAAAAELTKIVEELRSSG